MKELKMSKCEIALKIAWSYRGLWYKWGGDDPSGFDCSGLIVEILKSVGIIKRQTDYTASGLWNKFQHHVILTPKAGALVFWKTAYGTINHVEICIDGEHAIGASGGGSKTLTEADAIRQNAFIKIRPIVGRERIVAGYIYPF